MALVNLNKKLNSLDRRIYSRKRPGKKRWLGVLVVILIIATVNFFPARNLYQGFKEVSISSQALASAYQNQNFGQIVNGVTSIKKSLEKIDTSLNFFIWLKVIPVIGSYYSDFKSLSEAGILELTAFEVLLLDLKSYEKELGFLGQPLAGQDRITQLIKVLDKAQGMLNKLEPHFKEARQKVEVIDINKYPEAFQGIQLKETLNLIKGSIIVSHLLVSENRDALEITPAALGFPTPKNYLILFQNDKEIRATGGFITAFAFLKLDKGQVLTTISDDIYRLDERLLATCQSKICPLAPPGPIVKYLPEVTGKPRSAWSMRDSNLSPDLVVSAQEFERMYLLLGQGVTFDGIIYIDSQVVEELIEITGPIEVFGAVYSSEIDHRCNCPKVIYELESYAEVAARGEQDRKAVLGVLMSQMLNKIVGADIEKIPRFLDTIIRLANHKHIMFYMHNGSIQKALSKLNWTGEIKSFDGDYLHINDSNFAGGKSNLYVDQIVTQEINVGNGKTTKKITIEYKNPQPFNIWLNGINRDYIRIYTPKGSKLISAKGSDDPVNTMEELSKTVFDAFITVRPQNSRKLEIEYELPYNPQGEYRLMVQKQPGAKDFRYKIKINGRQVEDFLLDMDKQFRFSI